MEFMYLKKKITPLKLIMRMVWLCILILEYNFFLLKSFEQLSTGASNGMFVLTITGLVCLLLNGFDYTLFRNSKLIYLLILIIFLGIIRSMYLFPINSSQIIKLYISWFSVLLYFPITYYFSSDKNFFLNTLTLINIIFMLILIIQSSYFFSTGNLFLDEHYFIDNLTKAVKIVVREGNLRITHSWTIVMTSYLISISTILKKSNSFKFIHKINIIFTSIYLVLVLQTRVLIMILILSMLILVLANNLYEITLKKILLSILLFLFFVVLCTFTQLKDYIISFLATFTDEKYEISNTARKDALIYFWSIFKTNPFFGNGIYIGEPGSQAYFLARGPMGIFYYDDLGLIGNLAQFGFLPVILLFGFIKKNIVTLIDRENKYLGIFMIYYTLTMLATLSWLHKEAIIAFIISLCFIDSEFSLLKKVQKGDRGK